MASFVRTCKICGLLAQNPLDMDRFDPHPKRRIVPVNNINKIDGIQLEDIPEIGPGYAPGYVVIFRDWPYDVFLMRKREGLSHEEIYQLCDRLLKEKGIRPSAPPRVD